MTRRRALFAVACTVLAVIWSTAWSGLMAPFVPGHFTAHMIAHVTVMSLAAPLLAVTLASGSTDPTRRWPWLAAPIPAMLLELVVVWGWHVPVLHEAARTHTVYLLAEQGSFLAAGLLLWLSVLSGSGSDSRPRRAGGIIALLMTSMHMTLLGTLITLAPRALYPHHGDLIDQQVAGMVMLFGGATSYLAGGLWLMHVLLRDGPRSARRGGEGNHAPLG